MKIDRITKILLQMHLKDSYQQNYKTHLNYCKNILNMGEINGLVFF